MSNIVVVYHSRYGSTEQYARWISEEIGGTLMPADKCKVKNLSDFDTIVFGGNVHAGGIEGIRFLQKNYGKLQDKKIFVFAVGLNVDEPENQMQCREINFKKQMEDIPCFYFDGAYDPEKVSGMDKKMMKIVHKMIAGKKEEEITHSEKRLLDAIEHGADYVNRDSIKGLVEAIKAEQ